MNPLGFTIPEIDKLMEPYACKSYDKYYSEYINIVQDIVDDDIDLSSKACDYAMDKLRKDFEQGFQGLEYKLNTVSSSRGDYPFTTFTFGISTSKFGKMASEACLRVRMGGQGKPGYKKPVLFP